MKTIYENGEFLKVEGSEDGKIVSIEVHSGIQYYDPSQETVLSRDEAMKLFVRLGKFLKNV